MATVLGWLAGWIIVAYGTGRVRAAAFGAVIGGGVYWLLAMGPWFNINVGPTLVTTRLLALAEARRPGQAYLIHAQTSTDLSAVTLVQARTEIFGGGVVTSPGWFYAVTASAPVGPSPFELTGQWAFTWLVAALGGLFAWFLAHRASPRATASAAGGDARTAAGTSEEKP